MKTKAETFKPYAESLARNIVGRLDTQVLLLGEEEREIVFQQTLIAAARSAVNRATRKDPEFGRLMAEAFKNNVDDAVNQNVFGNECGVSEQISNRGEQPIRETTASRARTA